MASMEEARVEYLAAGERLRCVSSADNVREADLKAAEERFAKAKTQYEPFAEKIRNTRKTTVSVSVGGST